MLSIQLSPNEILYCLSSDGKIDRIGTLGIPGGSIDGEIEGLQKVSREVGATLSDDVPVQLLLDTDRVCLLPSERYRSDEAAALISLQPQEETVLSAARGGITALIAVNTKLYDILKKLFGSRIVISHPLLTAATEPDPRKAQIEIANTRNFIHVTLWNDGLLFAETFPRTPENLLLAVGYLKQTHPSTRFRIRVTGHDAEEVRHRLSRYFRKTDTVRVPKISKKVCDDKSMNHHLIHIIRNLHENH